MLNAQCIMLVDCPGCLTEDRNMKQFSSFENEVRPGVLMAIVTFSFSKQVLPSLVDMVAKCGHPV